MKPFAVLLCLITQLYLSFASDAHFLSNAYIDKINSQQDLWQAIAATQAFTDRYCIATRGKHRARLSTDNVLACCTECGDGCDGGWESKALEYFGTHGLPSGGLYNTSDGCQPYSIQSQCNYDDGSPYPWCPSTQINPICAQTCTNRLYP